MSENKKIKGAQKTKVGNIEFRSKLEARVAKCFDDAKIPYSYESLKIQLMPSFKYNGETLRSVHYTPDFLIYNYIIEVKGYPNDVWSLKKKLILRTILDNNLPYKFRQVSTIKETNEVIKEILKEHGKVASRKN